MAEQTTTSTVEESNSAVVDVPRLFTAPSDKGKESGWKSPDPKPASEPSQAASVTAGEPKPGEPKATETELEKANRDWRISEYYRLRKLVEEGKQPAPTQPAKVEEPKVSLKPVWDTETYKDKGGYDTYVEELADWKADQKLAGFKAELQAEKQTVSLNQQAHDTAKRFSENLEKSGIKDFDAVLKSAPVVFTTDRPQILQSLLEDDRGPQLFYHLASHPEDVARIDKLPLMAKLRELDKLGEKLVETAKVATPGTVQDPLPAAATKAPEPIDPLRPKTAESRPDPVKLAQDGGKFREFAAASGIAVQRGRFNRS